jgi:F0F1-type ATP synthase assembly protein I
MPSMKELKKKNQIDIPEEQEIIQTPIIMKYMLLDPDIVTKMIIWNKQVTEDITEIRTTLKKDKQEIQNIMNDLQEKLIENVKTIVTDKMNKFIHQEEKYKEKNMAFKIKTIFIAIIIGIIAGWIITLLN